MAERDYPRGQQGATNWQNLDIARGYPYHRPRFGNVFRSLSSLVVVALVAALVAGGCDKATHANIEKWRGTEQGPSKLEKALRDGDLDPDLRAHAAQVLVAIDKLDTVNDALSKMTPDARTQVVGKLGPRLWADAKTASESERPTQKSQLAKDGLYVIRGMAAAKDRDLIDGYLVDWLGGAYFDQRSAVGRTNGEFIVRAIGPKAAPKLIAAVRDVLKHPEEGNQIVPVTDGTLKGIALSGSQEGLTMLLDITEKSQHPDDTLQYRAIGAVYYAFIEFEKPPDPSALKPHLDRLAKLAADEDDYDGRKTNYAFSLLAKAGKPCIKPLAWVASKATDSETGKQRMWQAVQTGLKCGGADAIVAMAEAIPQDRKIARGIFEKYFWEQVQKTLGAESAAPARTLLGSKSWVARITGVYLLSRVGNKEDAQSIRKLAKDPAKLRGWWGEGDKTGKRPDPTLGAEAVVVADLLEKNR
jgi:hypothetical protein